MPSTEIVQQRPGLLPKLFAFLGRECPAFLLVQLWYLSTNLLQILGTATAVLPFRLEHPLPSALPHPAITVPQGTLRCTAACTSVLSSVLSVKPQRIKERKRKKPVAQE